MVITQKYFNSLVGLSGLLAVHPLGWLYKRKKLSFRPARGDEACLPPAGISWASGNDPKEKGCWMAASFGGDSSLASRTPIPKGAGLRFSVQNDNQNWRSKCFLRRSPPEWCSREGSCGDMFHPLTTQRLTHSPASPQAKGIFVTTLSFRTMWVGLVRWRWEISSYH